MSLLRLSACAAALLLAACAHEVQVVVVDPAKPCEPSAALLQACAVPTPLAEGLSFRDLVVGYQADRQSLARCALQQADLAKAVAACNDEIAKHNERLLKAQAQASGRDR